MKKLFTIIVVLVITGCASLPSSKFWTGQEQKEIPEVAVFETRNMAAWCPKYPNAFACAFGVGGQNPAVAVKKGFMSKRLLSHEFCHHLGYNHEVTLLYPTTDQWVSGDAPCPADVSRVKYRITEDL